MIIRPRKLELSEIFGCYIQSHSLILKHWPFFLINTVFLIVVITLSSNNMALISLYPVILVPFFFSVLSSLRLLSQHDHFDLQKLAEIVMADFSSGKRYILKTTIIYGGILSVLYVLISAMFTAEKLGILTKNTALGNTQNALLASSLFFMLTIIVLNVFKQFIHSFLIAVKFGTDKKASSSMSWNGLLLNMMNLLLIDFLIFAVVQTMLISWIFPVYFMLILPIFFFQLNNAIFGEGGKIEQTVTQTINQASHSRS